MNPPSNGLRVLFSGRMAATLSMGFASGLPLLLTFSLLQVWMREEGVDLGAIGLVTLLGLPYTLKFLWGPLLDRYRISRLGRRRGWMLATQIVLIGAIGAMGFGEPATRLPLLVGAALLVALASAIQDSVIDAYRREHLPEHELGLGSSYYVYGYRTGMLLASGGGLVLAGQISFAWAYWCMAAAMTVGVVTTMVVPEPAMSEGRPQSLREAVIEPFREFFTRDGAWVILLFVLLYKVGDSLASAMTAPFYVDLGFTPTEIGVAVKLFGFWATLGGALLGGLVLLRVGFVPALWGFGLLQMASTAGFAVLAQLGHNVPALAAVVAFENLSAGMGTAAFMAFMASMANRRFTATQYALLTSAMGVPRVLLSAPTGFLAESTGWPLYFLGCTLIAIPGLWLLRALPPETGKSAGALRNP